MGAVPVRVRTRSTPFLLFALVLWVLSFGGCSSGRSTPAAGGTPGTETVGGATVASVTHLDPTSFAAPGPWKVGEVTLALPASGGPVEVWYPASAAAVAGRTEGTYNVADWLPTGIEKLLPKGFAVSYPSGGVRGVAAARGSFPLVLFSHGYAGFRDQSTFLTAHLASWGFVVAAPDHYSRDLTAVLGGPTGAKTKTTDVEDLEATITLMASEDRDPSSFLYNRVDTALVGAVGHSAGGTAAEALAATDRQVRVFIGLAGATVGSFGQTSSGPGSIVPRQQGMLMVGSADHVVDPATINAAYKAMNEPKRLIVLKDFGHLVFADLCEIGSSKGGLLRIAEELHLQLPSSLRTLATDGCLAPDASPPTAWPVIRQAVTAELRHAFGFDQSLSGLDGLTKAYPTVVAVDQ